MKKLLLTLSVFFAFNAFAQHNPKTLISEDELPTIVERIIERRDSVINGDYKIRKIKSHFNLEFASSANAYFSGDNFEEMSFKMNRVRLEIYGRLTDHLSYHFRQSFNSYNNIHTVENLPASIEYANLKWRFNDRFDLVVGKQFLAVGGYEGYVNGLLVREFSEFNNNFAIFQTGVKGAVYLTPDQHLYFQVVNQKTGLEEYDFAPSKFPLLATACWMGWFADGAVNLQYSASAGQLAKGKNIYYLMCGNIYEKGPILAYLDVLYQRSGLDNQHRISSLSSIPSVAQNVQYLTVIANLDYRFHPKWNGYIKGAYETAGVYEANGLYAKGRMMTAWNAQACLEWFPFEEEKGFKVFAHYVYKGFELTDSAKALGGTKPHTQRISLGIQYIIPVL
ncbi:MAG: hypothetical protein IKZ08_04505 [Bacteroidales bacterium]|nr:hypothetical protein [Bacteroidales bacterium]MBR5862573.1 hypothetical protein [Bacteroidales bacterium]